MKLQSMTDYVLEQNKNWINELDVMTHFNNCVSYAHFLKQPLTIGMFIPTDENGNVLEEPKEIDDRVHSESRTYSLYELRVKQFQQAKDRVIFEGFENIELIEKLILLNETIEILDDLGITITETAVKKYGL